MVSNFGLLHRFKLFLKREEGSVETGLTLIPVMVLFLSVLQLPISALARVAYSANLQSDTYLQSFVSTSQGSSREAGYSETLSLPGGGQALVRTEKYQLLPITPLLIGGDHFTSVGISIDENIK